MQSFRREIILLQLSVSNKSNTAIEEENYTRNVFKYWGTYTGSKALGTYYLRIQEL